MEEIDFLDGFEGSHLTAQRRARINYVLNERGKGRTLASIGEELGLTRNRIMQIDHSGLMMLRRPSMQERRDHYIACYPERQRYL